MAYEDTFMYKVVNQHIELSNRLQKTVSEKAIDRYSRYRAMTRCNISYAEFLYIFALGFAEGLDLAADDEELQRVIDAKGDST